ncbi:MAG: DUF1638 domain-containing protein [Parasporobacterium sp.]|nr:DUF1638 domain-containing protein [Parasporobacterium sp.]
MRIKLIACKVLFREISYVCSTAENIVDITWIRQGKHNYPEELHDILQNEIDSIEDGSDNHTNKMNEISENDDGIAEDFDAIVLGYGLCSNAVSGLKTKSHKLVIPRAHDCITLFLGSKERYAEVFNSIPGCYWYTADWIENTTMPGQARHNMMVRYFEEQGYDEETIEFLMESLNGLQNYHNAAYIRMPFHDKEKYRNATKEAADFYGWQYHELDGDMSLFERLINGDWNEEDFLVLEPGESAMQAYDERVLRKVERQNEI